MTIAITIQYSHELFLSNQFAYMYQFISALGNYSCS